MPELQPEAPAQRRYHAAEARHAAEAKLREELLEQLKSENAFLKVTADKQAEKIEKLEKQTEKMEAEKIEKTITEIVLDAYQMPYWYDYHAGVRHLHFRER